MKTENQLPKYLQSDELPWMKWVCYKGEDFFACVNLEKSLAAHRPIVDLHFCVTKALNNCVLSSVNFKKELFTESHLAKL